MIINDDYKFCFIHIPKCAGTSVRQVLQPFDSLQGRFTGRVDNHAQLGMLDFVHIPLAILEKYFYSEFEKVKNYYSIAVVRDPYSRFSSSLTQRLRMYSKTPLKDRSISDLKKEIDQCIKYLLANKSSEVFLPEYIHFQKQTSYVNLNSTRLVDKVYTVDQIDQLFFDLEEKVGVSFSRQSTTPKANKSMVYRSAFIRKAYSGLKPVVPSPLKTVLPAQIQRCIINFVFVPRDRGMNEVFTEKYIKEFIADFYAEDIKLFNKVASSAEL